MIDSGNAAGLDVNILLEDYILGHWLPVVRKRLDPLTVRSYELNARVHIPHLMKRTRLRDVSRLQLKRLLLNLGKEHGLAESTVGKVAGVLRSIFESAADDELIPANPAAGLRPVLGIVEAKVEDVRAMDGGQLERFLAVAAVHAPGHFLEFVFLVYAGLRRGELRGLQVDDLDMEARTVRVERQVHDDGRIAPLKGRRGKKRPRTVDVAEALRDLLVPHLANRREYAMKTGARGPWLLYADWPAQPKGSQAKGSYIRLRRAMIATLKEAKLPGHFTPHCLRHTYARLMLERGEDVLYVSRQLGHASIALTADRYGHFARVKPRMGGANLLPGEKG